MLSYVVREEVPLNPTLNKPEIDGVVFTA